MKDKKIRVVIVDDHELIRDGLRMCLADEANIELVGEAENGKKGIQLVGELNPDVVLMDISMPVMNGLEATRYLTQKYPDLKILILTIHESKEYVLEILRCGAAGYLLKDVSNDTIVQAINKIYQGDSYISTGPSKILLDDYRAVINSPQRPLSKECQQLLTRREIDVLKLITQGFNNNEISQKLMISPRTVSTHREHINKKLHIQSLPELIRYAFVHGLIPLE